ncbi:MAG: NusG domain II-containing protein [Clostridia bacterium]|nr:NusG domain II-containing protein [Clostridia bacterium]
MRKLFYKRDFVILAVILLVALIGMGTVWIYHNFTESTVVVIEHNSVEINRINLDKIEQSDIIFINDDDGCHVEIEVENGRARVLSSTCPDKICVNCGWLENKGDSAVCLPNKVVVRIE